MIKKQSAAAGANVPQGVTRARPGLAGDRRWWHGAAIYQIYPRSFQDSNGDGIGDLLGVDGIWLSPFFASPMDDFGYDISDFCDVDPIFGTLHDFDRLVDKAHELGLKVTIDQVYSHTSDRHAWFEQSRQSRTNERADWYVWADARPDGTPPNNWLSVFGGSAWQWDSRRQQYYLHNFLVSQPDLNLHNPAVQDAVLDVARFWLDRGVDGFRLDALNFSMHDPMLRDNPAATRFKWPPKMPFDGPSVWPRASSSRTTSTASRTPTSRSSSPAFARSWTNTRDASRWPRSAARTRSRRCARSPTASRTSTRPTTSSSSTPIGSMQR